LTIREETKEWIASAERDRDTLRILQALLRRLVL
jgi:hypothetical protein